MDSGLALRAPRNDDLVASAAWHRYDTNKRLQDRPP
jgi:hypothetical protein